MITEDMKPLIVLSQCHICRWLGEMIQYISKYVLDFVLVE